MLNETHFTSEGITALEQMTNKGAVEASKALSSLINQQVTVTTVQVRTVPVSKVSDFISEPTTTVFGIKMGLAGDVFGQILLIFKEHSGINIADFMLKRPLGFTTELSELDKSALKESGNIIAGSFLSAISDYLSINILESPPDLMKTTLRQVLESAVEEFSMKQLIESIAVEINFNMATGIHEQSEASKIVPNIGTEGYFIILLDVESASKINASLKSLSGGKQMVQ